ncbi:MarR family transcriptional regulator [Streptosporangium soli]|nr:MarR family transcriptional regulator [Streptosporangium sp. KLBMP 9127]
MFRNSTFYELIQVADRLRGGFNTIAADLGLPPAQALLLVHLACPTPMRELAERMACDASNVTGIVDGLERRGLVVRRPSSDDRRVKLVAPTEEGKRRQAELREHGAARAEKPFTLAAGDRARLRHLLAEVAAVT